MMKEFSDSHPVLLWASSILVGLVLGLAMPQHARSAPPVKKSTVVATADQPKPMPQYSGDKELKDQWGRVLPDRDLLGGGGGNGLSTAPTPKFFFGVGLVVTIIAAVIKLAILAAVVFVIYHYIKNRRGSDGEEPKDVVDSLIASFDLLVAKVRAERDKRLREAEKLGGSLDKLKKGVANVVGKDTKE